MNKSLSDLIKISNVTGKDKALVQGGGGNTSVKTPDGKYMYLKASGTALKDMDGRNGWRRLCLGSVRSIINDKSIAELSPQPRELHVTGRLVTACDDNVTGQVRPSVEAHLHACGDKCVIHLHPTAVGAYVNAQNGKAMLDRLFKDQKLPLLWVPYADPGFMLAKKMQKLVGDYRNRLARGPEIIFLEKHGLIVSADTADKALRLVRMVIRKCNSGLKQPKTVKIKSIDAKIVSDTRLCIRRAFWNATGKYPVTAYFYNNDIVGFMAQKNAGKMLSAGVLTPDELLYASGAAMWVEKCDSKKISTRLTAQIKTGGRCSAAFLVKGVGLFVAAEEKLVPTIRDVALSSFAIRTGASRLGGISVLNKRQRNFINEWEAEAFRLKVAGGSTDGELAGRIAVVTGASSGLGRNIAIGLARSGAVVAIVDIDKKASQQTCELLKKEIPTATVLKLQCDVTSESEVDKAFADILNRWGGLDILVNAAGIAPAYPLIDLPADKWRLALEINLTGYFLMAKAAAKIMIKQQIGGGIINISSKSGIEASKNNTAYNATKAGELHMARGWAIELGEHNIRVNSVCPGNVFEGSKIWNPEYIKVCAKKYGIKPEEVIPYYVNKTMLKQEIKGSDVADAVVFLASDKSKMITAQTLVVDAGQVMVR